MAYVPALTKPAIVPRGQSVVRQLSIHSGTTQATVTGSYVLYNRAGASVASGSVTSGSVTITVPSDLELGTGAYEVWSLTSPITANSGSISVSGAAQRGIAAPVIGPVLAAGIGIGTAVTPEVGRGIEHQQCSAINARGEQPCRLPMRS